jgi:hypothetical protein
MAYVHDRKCQGKVYWMIKPVRKIVVIKDLLKITWKVLFHELCYTFPSVSVMFIRK